MKWEHHGASVFVGITSFNKQELLSIFQGPRIIPCAPAGEKVLSKDEPEDMLIDADLSFRGTNIGGQAASWWREAWKLR